MSEFLSVPEVAERLGLHPATVYRMAAAGVLPAVRIGPRVVRVPVAEFERWVSEQVAGSRTKSA